MYILYTVGCMLLATNSKTASIINKEVSSRRMRKTYTALCLNPFRTIPPIGLIQHGFRRVSKTHINAKPTLLCKYDPNSMDITNTGQEWQLAELVILSSRQLILQNTIVWECEIDLITGRTHQIRLQMSALGFPLWGDSRYIPIAGMLDDGVQDGSGFFGMEPTTGIGLHCSSVEVCEEDLVIVPGVSRFVASEPWWRAQAVDSQLSDSEGGRG